MSSAATAAAPVAPAEARVPPRPTAEQLERKRKADRDRQAKYRQDALWTAKKNASEKERQRGLRADNKTLTALKQSLPVAPTELLAHLRQRRQQEAQSLDDIVKAIYAYSESLRVDDDDAGCTEEGRRPRLCRGRVPVDRQFGPAEAVLREWQESTSLAQHGFCLCDLSGSPDRRRLVGQLKGYAPTRAARWMKLVNGKQVEFGRSGFSESGRIMCVAFRSDNKGGLPVEEGTESLLSDREYLVALKMVKDCAPGECGREIETYALQQIQYLLSIPDCPRQPQHTDFPTVPESGISGADGLTILIALDADAAWYIQPYGLKYEIRIQVPRFWAIVFKGDVPHAGAELAGTRVNDMRYHMYLTRSNAKVPDEKDGSIYNVRYL